jgi:hypothetical protein
MTQESAQWSALPNAAVEMLWRGNLIEEIKLVRAERNLGLKKAKDLAGAYVRSSNVQKRLPMPFLYLCECRLPVQVRTSRSAWSL